MQFSSLVSTCPNATIKWKNIHTWTVTFKKLAKTCQVKHLQYNRIRNLAILTTFNMSVPNTVLWLAKRWELEFAPMSEIRRKVQQCKSCHNVVSEWFYKLSHLSVMLMSVYSINSGYQGLKGPLSKLQVQIQVQNTTSLVHWAAQMHFSSLMCVRKTKDDIFQSPITSINIIFSVL